MSADGILRHVIIIQSDVGGENLEKKTSEGGSTVTGEWTNEWTSGPMNGPVDQ